MSEKIKWFISSMAGAPTLSGTAGALVALLDACLINGFGAVTLDSLAVASNVATLTKSAGHNFLDRQVIEISGATPAALNGAWRFSRTSATAGTFATVGISDQTATGTITAKTAPVGDWSKAYSGTDKAAYRSLASDATGLYLRVDDTGAQNARAVGYETMSDVNTGVNAFPTDAQVSGGLYWPKSTSASSAARNWALVSDGKALHLFLGYSASYPLNLEFEFFGDPSSNKAGDAFGCAIAGPAASNLAAKPGFSTNNASCVTDNTSTAGCYLARAHTQVGTAIAFVRHSLSAFGGGSLAVPNATDNRLYLEPMFYGDSGGVCRGAMPGLYLPRNAVNDAYATGDLTVTATLAGTLRTFLAVRSAKGATPGANVWLDITGPWAW